MALLLLSLLYLSLAIPLLDPAERNLVRQILAQLWQSTPFSRRSRPTSP